MTTDWSSALDAFEARLHAQAQALDAGGDPTVAPFEPPVMTEPLPSDLVNRATGLVQRCRDIEFKLADALERAGAALERSARTPVAAGADQQPVYFDSRV